jgi:thymidylate synthase (FAD)
MDELYTEMEARCQANPDFTRRIGSSGFLELEASWGDEATILNTARISTSNTRLASVADCGERDRSLLEHLLKNDHGTPFETVYFRWRIVAPIFVLRQWMRHRIGTFNEFSQRYRQPIRAYYVPDDAACHVDGVEILTEAQRQRYCDLMEQLHRFYQDEYAEVCQRLDSVTSQAAPGVRNAYRGRARELLRNVMPVATYSDLYWTVNFRALMNFFRLRCDSHAQYEIRQYAAVARELAARRFPLLMDTMDRVLAGPNMAEVAGAAP